MLHRLILGALAALMLVLGLRSGKDAVIAQRHPDTATQVLANVERIDTVLVRLIDTLTVTERVVVRARALAAPPAPAPPADSTTAALRMAVTERDTHIAQLDLLLDHKDAALDRAAATLVAVRDTLTEIRLDLERASAQVEGLVPLPPVEKCRIGCTFARVGTGMVLGALSLLAFR